MSDNSLFGKTFDQQVEITGDDIASQDIVPNRRIPSEMVFEPMGNGVRVTARDEKHRVLWGYIASKGTVNQYHCLVAIYETLQDLVVEELDKRGIVSTETTDTIDRANQALDALESTVKWLRDGLEVKKVSEATLRRAKEIARIVCDVDRQITLEASSLKGMKPRGDAK